jgi:hypothetical protein
LSALHTAAAFTLSHYDGSERIKGKKERGREEE